MKENIVKIKKGEAEYPEKLALIQEAPEQLYCIGNIELLQKRSIAVVGSRKCSEYGKQVAMRIGGAAAQNGLVTVSGMARGIDSYAHLGALKKGGETIAVLACGVDVCYPPQNWKIYEQIKQEGLVISEMEPGTQALPFMFPMRNRIISGLSEAVAVTEAGTGSGALITAEFAATQGREVFCVPGNITNQYSLGSNKLLMDGGRAIAVVDDIFTEIGITPKSTPEELAGLGKDEAEIYNIVKENGETTVDFLCQLLHKDASTIIGIVGILEIKGMVNYTYGKIFVAKF